MREPRNDKRNKPTKEPNSHYYFEMFIKHVRPISAALVFIIGFICMMFYEISDKTIEIHKMLLCMCGGYLFGNATNKST